MLKDCLLFFRGMMLCYNELFVISGLKKLVFFSGAPLISTRMFIRIHEKELRKIISSGACVGWYICIVFLMI